MSRTRSGTFPSDRVSDRPANDKRMSREDGASHARLRHLTPEEQALKDKERADAHGNLAAMCFERVEIDLSYAGSAEEQEVPHRWTQLPTTSAPVAGARDFLLLADMLGLGGLR